MGSLILIFAIAFSASLALTIAMRKVALKWNIVDRPDGLRKLHDGEKPLGGGVAVYLALTVGLLTAACLFQTARPELWQLSRVVILASGFVCLFGCIDDVFRLNARFKLIMQICAVLPIAYMG
jgi:UDP-GlcNAc:undecaprenyl-phosphate GlcNAc-1-phosphate transferase